MDDENNQAFSSEILEPKSWRERYRWLGILMMAAFAGFGPAPPPPKPPQDISAYSQIAEDPDAPKLDPELHFLQNDLDKDESSMNARRMRIENGPAMPDIRAG